MTHTPVDDLDICLRAVGDVVAGVRDDQWANETPCTQWCVRDVVNHLALGSRLFAGLLAGRPGYPLDPAHADALGDNPAGSYRGHAAAVVTAFRQPGALEQPLAAPVGTIPGAVAVRLRTVEDLVHGWDIAVATGQRVHYPDDVVERALAFTREQLAGMGSGNDSNGESGETPDAPDGPDGGNAPFAPPQPHPDDAPPIDRLVALLGRRLP